MNITFDPAKNATNLAKHGLPLSAAVDMDLAVALIRVDDRADYGETRYEAIGPLNGRVCVLVFTVRDQVVRVISLRKANSREVKRYAQHP
ncbi:BrnT family toxin [Azospirillum sp. B4]|uniref:BrnT family toxin n=1 Tax=Azospirillum sp. B4 TaxID=95605 RepID=UPI000347A426|nr:BrnT family toxin [Azospirillum sp. B4]